jgi:hypothetical protein
MERVRSVINVFMKRRWLVGLSWEEYKVRRGVGENKIIIRHFSFDLMGRQPG